MQPTVRPPLRNEFYSAQVDFAENHNLKPKPFHFGYAIAVVLLLLLIGCLSDIEPSSTPELTSSFSPSPTLFQVALVSDGTLGSAIQGDWVVSVPDSQGEWRQLGTLTIVGDTYVFEQTEFEPAAWVEERFCFFNEPQGEVVYEYRPDVSPEALVSSFDDRAILLSIYGLGCREGFFIQVDQQQKRLSFHAQHSELQFYSISREYE